jgi:2-dehydropantoate 2-reductase
MKITIIGSGAIGGVLGAYLTRGNHDVTLCDVNKEHVKQMNVAGLTIEGPDDTFTVPVQATTPEELLERAKPLEAVYLCVKAHHTREALSPLLPLLTENSYVVSFQNGLCEDEIASLVGESRTVGCFVNFSADYLEPAKILYGGVASLYIGELDGSLSPRIQSIQETLSCWGPAQTTTNVWGYLWGKMSYAGLLYATALVDETMVGVVRKMEYRDALMEICSEILEVADKEGVHPLGFDDWEPSLVFPRESRNQSKLNAQLEQLAERMATNKKTKSGIWRDLAVRKRKTEVDRQLVPIIEIGKKHGISMPLTTLLVQAIQELEAGIRQMSWDNLTELNNLYKMVHSQ